MAITDISESPEFKAALGKGVESLQQLARYELDAPIQQRLRDLGERKEFLSPPEHDELIALVRFTEKRQIEKLDAQVARRHVKNPKRAGCPGH